jgi:CoA:oxalate CoA-transferase
MTKVGPLADIVVIDLTRVLAGPFCTLLLADLGARVIKVEQPGTGDDSRSYGPFLNGKSGYFLAQNRGKESIALDLKSKDDLAILHRLLAGADVLAENFRPGAMDRLGLGWRDLEERYPRLIYAAASGFGQTGPYAERPAYDVIAQAMGGLMSLTGHEGGPPTRVGSAIGDLGAGIFLALGVLSALHHRARTGRGIMVDVAMLDCQLALLENSIIRYYASGNAPKPTGARHPSIAPFEPYRAADGFVVIACGNDELFRRLAAALGRPDLPANPSFVENSARIANVVALKETLEGILGAHDVAHWLRLLGEAGIPCAPINDVADICADPQIAARNMLVGLDDPELSGVRLAGMPIKLSAYPDLPTRPGAPALDADRERILRDFPA